MGAPCPRDSEVFPDGSGVLGLGCGTLAAYGKPGDTYRIYEINPLVVQLANKEFTYLRDTPAKVEIVLGDCRLSLEREPSQQFDVLVMDAFSGDSVPVHLLTREAFEIYFRHLKPGGILAVNITNAYLDLRNVIERAATHFGRIAIHYSDYADDSLVCFPSDWALIAPPSIRESAPGWEAAWPAAAQGHSLCGLMTIIRRKGASGKDAFFVDEAKEWGAADPRRRACLDSSGGPPTIKAQAR